MTESALRKAAKKHFLMTALFIYMAAYALKTLNTVISRLIEKLW